MIDSKKVIEGLEKIKSAIIDAICYEEGYGSEHDLNTLDDAMELLRDQGEEIRELREVLTEMSTNGGTGNQQDVCRYLLRLMDVIEERQRRADDEPDI